MSGHSDKSDSYRWRFRLESPLKAYGIENDFPEYSKIWEGNSINKGLYEANLLENQLTMF